MPSVSVSLAKELVMTEVVVVIGPGQIGQAIARRVAFARHIFRAEAVFPCQHRLADEEVLCCKADRYNTKCSGAGNGLFHGH